MTGIDQMHFHLSFGQPLRVMLRNTIYLSSCAPNITGSVGAVEIVNIHRGKETRKFNLISSNHYWPAEESKT